MAPDHPRIPYTCYIYSFPTISCLHNSVHVFFVFLFLVCFAVHCIECTIVYSIPWVWIKYINQPNWPTWPSYLTLRIATHLSVHVGAVQINLAAVFVDQVADQPVAIRDTVRNNWRRIMLHLFTERRFDREVTAANKRALFVRIILYIVSSLRW